jgi:hypothetical protein
MAFDTSTVTKFRQFPITNKRLLEMGCNTHWQGEVNGVLFQGVSRITQHNMHHHCVLITRVGTRYVRQAATCLWFSDGTVRFI